MTSRPSQQSASSSVPPSTDTITTIYCQRKAYDIPTSLTLKYPNLMDPIIMSSIFDFDICFMLIQGLPPSCIPSDRSTDYSKKQILLQDLEKLEFDIPDPVKLYLSPLAIEEFTEARKWLIRWAGPKGLRKNRAKIDQALLAECVKYRKTLASHGCDLDPMSDILEVLSNSEYEDAVSDMVILDFKSKNLVLPCVQFFLKKFRQGV